MCSYQREVALAGCVLAGEEVEFKPGAFAGRVRSELGVLWPLERK